MKRIVLYGGTILSLQKKPQRVILNLGNTFSYRIGEEGHGLTVLGDEQGNMQSILDSVEIVANHNEMSKYNESPWLDIGLSEVGVKEESDNWSPRIAEYLASCGLYKRLQGIDGP